MKTTKGTQLSGLRGPRFSWVPRDARWRVPGVIPEGRNESIEFGARVTARLLQASGVRSCRQRHAEYGEMASGLVHEHQDGQPRSVSGRKIASQEEHSKRASGITPGRHRVETGSKRAPNQDGAAAVGGQVGRHVGDSGKRTANRCIDHQRRWHRRGKNRLHDVFLAGVRCLPIRRHGKRCTFRQDMAALAASFSPCP